MKKDKIPFWQGDLVLYPVDKIPSNATPINSKILAYGEATGHSHRLKGNAQILQVGEQIFVDAKERAELVHETHRPRIIEPGLYELRHEEEYEPFTETFRRVLD